MLLQVRQTQPRAIRNNFGPLRYVQQPILDLTGLHGNPSQLAVGSQVRHNNCAEYLVKNNQTSKAATEICRQLAA